MFRGITCGLAILLLGNITTAADRTPKVLFIGIDGCRWDAIEAAKTPADSLTTPAARLALRRCDGR